jgi:methionyl aminopeptidase
MAQLKTLEDVERMGVSCRLAAQTLEYLKAEARAGVSTLDLDRLAEVYIRDHGAVPSPKGYRGYPNSICTAVNEVVVHGIPTKKPLRAGDLITIDVTVYKGGFHGDKAASIIVPGADNRAAERLMAATERSMYRGIYHARAGARLGDIGAAIQEYVEGEGYSVVRDLCGHGIGRQFHEDPHVLNYGRWNTGRKLRAGMVFTVEPMINEGTWEVSVLSDGWTVVTKDGKLSAQFEHTVAIMADGPRILTLSTEHEAEMWRAERARMREEVHTAVPS